MEWSRVRFFLKNEVVERVRTISLLYKLDNVRVTYKKILSNTHTQLTFTCSKSKMETLEKDAKYV